MENELAEKIKTKHILFDTTIISKIFKNINEQSFKDFFNFLSKIGCPIIINDFIKAEFLRDSMSENMLSDKSNFLTNLFVASLPVEKDLFTEILPISNIYVHNGINGVSLVDLIMSASLRKYVKNMVLITQNHKDFSLKIHDRIGNIIIDTQKESPLVFGFYVFNEEKYNNEMEKFKKSKA